MDQHSTKEHRLAPLLTPRAVALIGASPKPGTVGRGMITSTSMPGTPSRIHLINPNYPEIDGQKCYAALADLPERVDMAVLGVANARLEAALQDAIENGVRAATIFASCYLENDRDPKLTARLSAMAKEAGWARRRGRGCPRRRRSTPSWSAGRRTTCVLPQR